MKQIVNIDGVLYPPEEARISVFDHGFLFGDSIYETLRTYNNQPFLLDRHLKRLQNSARMLQMKLPLSDEAFSAEVLKTVAATKNDECYIRLIVTRGAGRIGLDIRFCEKPTFVVFVNPLDPYPASYYEDGVTIAIVSIRRNDRASLNPQIKSSNLLNNVLAYTEARQQGAFEGVLCNLSGFVAECTGSNIFMVKSGKVFTPPPEAGLLEGVTRALVFELASSEKIEVEEKNITPDELMESDECFITSTTKEILPVRCINHTNVASSPGPVTLHLMRAYRNFVSGLGV